MAKTINITINNPYHHTIFCTCGVSKYKLSNLEMYVLNLQKNVIKGCIICRAKVVINSQVELMHKPITIIKSDVYNDLPF